MKIKSWKSFGTNDDIVEKIKFWKLKMSELKNFEKLKIKKCEKVESCTLKIWKPSLRTTEDTHSGDEIGSKHEYKRKLGKKKQLLNM